MRGRWRARQGRGEDLALRPCHVWGQDRNVLHPGAACVRGREGEVRQVRIGKGVKIQNYASVHEGVILVE